MQNDINGSDLQGYMHMSQRALIEADGHSGDRADRLTAKANALATLALAEAVIWIAGTLSTPD